MTTKNEHLILTLDKQELIEFYEHSKRIVEMSQSGCLNRTELVRKWLHKYK